LKGQPAKDENKKLSIKNKTQQQPDNFDIRDFISSEEEYDSFEDAEDDPEDGEYRGRNILPASVRSQIQLLGTYLCVLPITPLYNNRTPSQIRVQNNVPEANTF
jgi:hypothetical protein